MALQQDQGATIAQIAARYLTEAPLHDKPSAQQEINRFIRWCRGDRFVSQLTPHELELYAESCSSSYGDAGVRLQPLKSFFRYVSKKGLTPENLGVHLKVKRVSGARRNGRNARAGAADAMQLTPEGFALLQGELEELKSRRVHIAEELKRAMADKDFRENAPLDAAREAQGMTEARIRELEHKLRSATLIEGRNGERSSRVRLGCRVTVRDLANSEEFLYVLVNPSEVNPSTGKISVMSPTGRALLEHELGDEVDVSAPAGKLRYRVVKVEG
ncbi:MAG: transcription elongation factor GreA [Dehalococcoidia bacterium]|nr:transcription elongation factor GreA [Dehalococcoidia bacterium]